jgi:3D (Asp-Asp-Asp) domain-containing protein
MGMYVIEDAMAPRWERKADIWFGDAATARSWGIRNAYITRVSAGEPLLVSSAWNR